MIYFVAGKLLNSITHRPINFCVSFIVALMIYTSAHAQNDSLAISSKGVYFNSFLSGGLLGEKDKGTSFSFSMINGVRFNRVALGAGLGHDNYLRWRANTAFGSIAYDLFRKNNSNVFFQYNMGYGWMNHRSPGEGYPTYNADGGLMINPALGYRLSSGNFSMYLTAGYKWQRNDYSYTPSFWSRPWGSASVVTITEDSERLSVHLGFGWR